MARYELRYYNDGTNQYVLLWTAATVDELATKRVVSGDLIVDAETEIVVDDPSWLWPWEHTRPNYARSQLGKHRPGKICGPALPEMRVPGLDQNGER